MITNLNQLSRPIMFLTIGMLVCSHFTEPLNGKIMHICTMRFRPLLLLGLIVTPLLFGVQYAGDDYVEFTAYIAEDKVNVHWTATSRSKIESYVLERSRNGEDFEAFKTVIDEGKKPETAEFLESDFKPMLGWSYYRIKQNMKNGKEYVTHIVPVFYRADRMKKGKIIVAEKLSGSNTTEAVKASDFNGQELVFVLRNPQGEEFYYEATLTVDKNRFTLPVSATVPAGEYMISACSKTSLLGIEVTVE